MKVNMLIVVAMAFANRARAACNVPSVFVNGFVSGGSAACTLEAVLDATPCTVAADTGYAVDSASLEYSCSSSTVTPPAAVITGCAANYYQESGTTAADIKCTVCPAGKTIATANVGGAATVCDMCKENFFQASGTSSASFTCTACASGTTIGSATAGGAATTCSAASSSCKVPSVFVNGFVSGGSAACTLGADLDATPCTVAADTGYAVDSASIEYSCSSGTVTPPAAVITGCAANYYQESGTTAADIKCTVCPAGKTRATANVGGVATVCDMCKANFFQASGTSSASFTCTACASGTTIGSATAGGAATTCSAASSSTAANSTTKAAGVASTSPKTPLWGKHIVLGVVMSALAAYEF